jgi:predicted metal-binding membrane protein
MAWPHKAGPNTQSAPGVIELPLPRRLIANERFLPGCALLLAVIAAWAYLWSGAGTLQEMGGEAMPMSAGPWTPGHALVMLAMWIVMMTAMMLPSASPMILLFATIARAKQAKGQRRGSTTVFVLGYLAVWSAFSLLAVLLQFTLEKAALLSPMMEATSAAFAAAVLIAAGVYQWTPLKQACLSRCRSPLDFVIHHWHEGQRGAFRMGVLHGAYCVGCCWLLMLVLFVGGVMNLAWVLALAALVLAEKLVPAGHWIGRVAGAGLIGWGGLLLSQLR